MVFKVRVTQEITLMYKLLSHMTQEIIHTYDDLKMIIDVIELKC